MGKLRYACKIMSEMKKLAIVMDPIASIKPNKDTSLALLRAAQASGYQLFYIEIDGLYMRDGKPFAQAKELEVFNTNTDYYRLGDDYSINLDAMDLVLMRKDPPVEQRYIYATWVLSSCVHARVINNPQALRDCNEKVFATQFPDLCPPNLISNNIKDLKAFYQQYEDVIVKPLDGMGGKGIFRLTRNALNVNATLEMLSFTGTVPVMIEPFIPEIIHGDKRILLIDGEPIAYGLARIPSADDRVRGNIAAGGSVKVKPLTQRDWEICHRLAPELRKRGLFFVGIDVIGDYLTEINITSPTGLQEISRETSIDIAGQFFDLIEKAGS